MRDTGLIAVVGKSASGKDTLVNEMCRQYPALHRVKRTTSRPRRPDEGDTYHFITKNDFKIKRAQGAFAESRFFRGWGYGTERSEIHPLVGNIGAFDLKSACELEKVVEDILIVYLDVPLEERLRRYKRRNGGKASFEMYRRAISEAIDYSFLELKVPHFIYKISSKRSAAYNAAQLLEYAKGKYYI